MKYDPIIHHRHSIRLKEYDYSEPGAYFVTVVTRSHKNIFGRIIDDKMIVNPLGEIVGSTWLRLPSYFLIRLDEWVIMPNHLHGIIWIIDSGKGEAFGDMVPSISKIRVPNASPLQPSIGTMHGSLGAIVQNFKSVSTRKIHQWLHANSKGEGIESVSLGITEALLSNASLSQVWQRNYFERVVRNEKELDRIRGYIIDNPRKWAEDEDYHA